MKALPRPWSGTTAGAEAGCVNAHTGAERSEAPPSSAGGRAEGRRVSGAPPNGAKRSVAE